MLQGNCALKFDPVDDFKNGEHINKQKVNLWLEKNKKRMEKASVMQPMNWCETLCSA